MGIPFSFLAVGTVELGLGARPICLRARNRLCWAIQKGWSNLALGYWRRQGTNNWISTASSWTLSTPTAYFALLDWYFQHSHSLFWLLGNAEALVVRRPSQTCGHRSQLSYKPLVHEALGTCTSVVLLLYMEVLLHSTFMFNRNNCTV